MKTICIICVIAVHNVGKYMFPIERFWQVLQPIPLFLLISGFNFGNSFKRKNLHTLKEMYTVQYLKKCFWRVIFPLFLINLVCFIIDLIAVNLTNLHVWGWSNPELHVVSWGQNNAPAWAQSNLSQPLLSDILMGSPIFPGPGTYYIPILIQFVMLFPLIYKLFDKSPILGLIACFLIELIFQLWIIPLIVGPVGDNNLFFCGNMFRYISAIGLGVWFVNNHNIFSKKNLPIVAMSLLSLFLLLAFFFGDLWFPWLDNFNILGHNIFRRNDFIDYGYSLSFFRTEPWWGKSNIFTYFYPATIFLIFMKILPSNLNENKKISRGITRFFKSFSKITYHILLVQLVFFWVYIPISATESFQWNDHFYIQYISDLAGPYANGFNLRWLEVPFNDALAILYIKYIMFIITFIVVLILSGIFYVFENKLQKGIKLIGSGIKKLTKEK